MRRFALGVLRLKPEEFGKMMVGDFLDAVRGFNEEKVSQLRLQASIARTAVTIMVNVQPGRTTMVTEEEVWKFPWEDNTNGKQEEITPQEIEEHLKKAEDFFKNRS